MPNPIYGTSGDDSIYGTGGSDIYYPGACVYGDYIFDPGGDDYYVLGEGFSFIHDAGGTDVATMAGQSLEDLNFMVWDEGTVAIGIEDGSVGAWFQYMISDSNSGPEYLVLDDVTLTREEIITLAFDNFGWT